MEICESLTTDEELMSPPGAEGSFSLSGIPPEVVEAMRDLAADRGVTMKDIYSEAATGLLAAVRGGERYEYISTLGGSSRKTIWVHPEVAHEVDAFVESIRRSRSSFMLTAIKRFLIANERSVDF
jgi:hypothetical protein